VTRSSPGPAAARRALARVCRANGVRALYAFGSRERQAWGLLGGVRARGRSDLDLAVLWLEPGAADRFVRRAQLEEALCARLRGVQL
jgi:predicted nucleotidyltransferase